VERFDEKPPVNIFAVLSRILLFILFFVPLLGLFILSGVLSFVFAFIGFQSLSQLFNPFVWSTSFYEFIELFILRRIRGTDTEPFYRGVLEDTQSRESTFLFRGPLKTGNLVPGHNVALRGHWCGGTFEVREGTDRTTNSAITSNYRNPWRAVFSCLIVLYGILGITVYVVLR